MSFTVFLNKFERMIIDGLIKSNPLEWKDPDFKDNDNVCFDQLFKVLIRFKSKCDFNKNLHKSLEKLVKFKHTHSFSIEEDEMDAQQMDLLKELAKKTKYKNDDLRKLFKLVAAVSPECEDHEYRAALLCCRDALIEYEMSQRSHVY